MMMSHPFGCVPALQVIKIAEGAGRAGLDVQQSLVLIGRKHKALAKSTATAVQEWGNPA